MHLCSVLNSRRVLPMKRLVFLFFFFFLMPGGGLLCRASHIFGGDLLYTYISGNTYRVTLTLYGDCNAKTSNPSLFAQLYTATPIVHIYFSGSFVYTDSFVLHLNPGSGVEVSPVCPGKISQTTCNGGTLPGVIQFIYSDTLTLPFANPGWKFAFKGELGGSGAGRSQNITNAMGGTIMELIATLNNSTAPNSSPVYSNIPTPFYCINILQQYNQGAIDPNGDSLVFSLVPALNANTDLPVSYFFPFSAGDPLSTTSGGFNFYPLNGQMTFTPNIVQDALVVNRVSEYRDGFLVGTSEREMTFIVLDNCDATPPSPYIANLIGATLSSGNVINICRGTPLVTFSIDINNPNGDLTTLTPSGVPTSATLSVIGDSTSNPSVNFSWNTATLLPGVYTFFLNIKNNHCPLSNSQTAAYTINVANPPTINAQQLSETQCIHPAGIQFTMTEGFLPYKITVSQGGSVVKTVTDSTSQIVIDSLPAGTYTAVVRSDSLCQASVSFTISDSGALPVSNITESLCKGDPSFPIEVTPVAAGAVISWFNADGTPLSSAPIVNTTNAATYSWTFVETYKTCTSGLITVDVTVHNQPTAEILNIPQTVCYGDQIQLEATGGSTYTWTPADIVKSDTNGQYVEIITPVTLVVTVTDQYGCSGSATVEYSDIQQCCNFSFPNAFTPNGDGHNDGFRIVTYGNMRHYSLTIYNRWGQQVFWTGDPKSAWDGKFGGEPCEMGVYYYHLDAECLTGPKEIRNGDITLIR